MKFLLHILQTGVTTKSIIENLAGFLRHSLSTQLELFVGNVLCNCSLVGVAVRYVLFLRALSDIRAGKTTRPHVLTFSVLSRQMDL